MLKIQIGLVGQIRNWEALACSCPRYVESMISTFVNAGTPDGYNPYRVTRDGVIAKIVVFLEQA